MQYGGRTGKYVKYQDRIWIIIYDNAYSKDMYGLQIIPEEPFGSTVKIGAYNDIEKTIKDYNNYEEILNNACKTLVPEGGFVKKTRSIGTSPTIETNEENTSAESMFKHEYLENNYAIYNNTMIQSKKIITDWEAYLYLYNEKGSINKIEKDYWFWYSSNNTRYLKYNSSENMPGYTGDSGIYLSISHVDLKAVESRELGGHSMVRFTQYYEDKNHMASGASLNVLPVVTLEQGVLEGVEGDGETRETAYNLD